MKLVFDPLIGRAVWRKDVREGFDLTPKTLHVMLFGMPFLYAPDSTVSQVACPYCFERNSKTGHVRPIVRMTKCDVCNDMKMIPIPGMFPGVIEAFCTPKKEKTDD